MRFIATWLVISAISGGDAVLAADPQGAPAFPTVQLASDGLVPGVIMVADPTDGREVPALDLSVVFMQKGQVKAVTKPGISGVFQAKGLIPGRYSLLASGKSGYFASEVEVVAAPPRVAPVRPTKLAETGAPLMYRGLAVPPADLAMVVKVTNSYLPPTSRTAAPAQLIPEGDVLTADELQNGNATAPVSPDAPYVVELQADGKVLGQLRRYHPQTGQLLKFHHLNVFLVSGDALPQKVQVAPNGNFEFTNVEPGHYSVVAAGAEGFTAFGVHVIASRGAVAAKSSRPLIVNVSFHAKRAGSSAIAGSVIDSSNLPEAIRRLNSAAQAGSSNEGSGGAGAGTAGGGGGTGGGGVGAGGGGGLGLLGAALGAAALAAAAADDNPSSP